MTEPLCDKSFYRDMLIAASRWIELGRVGKGQQVLEFATRGETARFSMLCGERDSMLQQSSLFGGNHAEKEAESATTNTD